MGRLQVAPQHLDLAVGATTILQDHQGEANRIRVDQGVSRGLKAIQEVPRKTTIIWGSATRRIIECSWTWSASLSTFVLPPKLHWTALCWPVLPGLMGQLKHYIQLGSNIIWQAGCGWRPDSLWKLKTMHNSKASPFPPSSLIYKHICCVVNQTNHHTCWHEQWWSENIFATTKLWRCLTLHFYAAVALFSMQHENPR